MYFSDFDSIYSIVDASVPKNTFMCGRYKQSHAYYTLREKLPGILTSIIDSVTLDADEIPEEYGGNSREEVTHFVDLISKLLYQLQTDKPLECFEGSEPDKQVWNNFIGKLPRHKDSFFKICWLYAECYMYRKLYSFIEGCRCLRNFDYFAKQKINATQISAKAMARVVKSTRKLDNTPKTFRNMLKLSLWGNRCDLSLISKSNEKTKPKENAFQIIEKLDSNVLIEDAMLIWYNLAKASKKNENENEEENEDEKPPPTVLVDYICDNAGYELFTDFILAEYIIEKRLATKIRFNVKAIPWFVSDVTPNDFHWMLKYLQEHKSKRLRAVGFKWRRMLEEGFFELAPVDYFWTSPHEFHKMSEISPELYERLSEAQLLIFKGDLNYRKLVGDFTWNFTESFKKCLQGFQPTNLCALRTIKADILCGLREGCRCQAKELFEKDPNWMLAGEYGVIQFARKTS